MKIKFSSFLRIFISFSLLGLLFWIMRDDVRGIWRIVTASNLRIIALAAVIIVFNVTLLAYRMKVVFLGENLDITFRESVQLTFIGYFFNNLCRSISG